MRIHGLIWVFAAPLLFVGSILLFFFLKGIDQRTPDFGIINIVIFITAPFIFCSVFIGPIFFFAGLIQFITGKRIGMIESGFEKEKNTK